MAKSIANAKGIAHSKILEMLSRKKRGVLVNHMLEVSCGVFLGYRVLPFGWVCVYLGSDAVETLKVFFENEEY